LSYTPSAPPNAPSRRGLQGVARGKWPGRGRGAAGKRPGSDADRLCPSETTTPAPVETGTGAGEAGRRAAPPRQRAQSLMAATTPAPTVRPPSRMAKRSFSSMATGTISATSMVTLSPGITISVPSGSVQIPVTSVVRK